MKIMELKENEPLKVIEVSRRCKPRSLNLGVVEWKKIKMRIFTDGEIVCEDEVISQNIDEYYIGKTKYPYDVNILKTKNVYFKNHSYVITYVIAEELMKMGNIGGWFDVVKDVSVYLENSKDRKALKTAKQVICEIEKRNRSVDYSSSLLTMLASQSRSRGLEKLETEVLSDNVYSLSRTR